MKIANKNYKQYELDNGLVVAMQNTPTETIAAKLRINYGSSHEQEGEEGLAHFLEHCLVSSGSEKYSPLTADEIRTSFGDTNAFTNIGRINFTAQILSQDLEAWLDYISDHVFNPRFDKERVNGERERVLREIADEKSNPMYLARREFMDVFYRGHPKGRFNLGKEEVVKQADLDKIRSFHAIGFHPNNMDLLIAGKLPENIDDLIKKYFENNPRGENTRKKFPELAPLEEKIILHRSAPERNNIDNPEESSAQIFLYYLGPVDTHKDEYAVRIMNHILGGYTNSLLFQNMGLKKGLAYYVKTSYEGDYNCGELGIDTFVPAKRINEAIDAIFEEIHKMKTQKVKEKTIDRIKRIKKFNLALAFESNVGHINIIEYKLDENLTPESFIEAYNKVTPEKVLEVANRYLPDKEIGKYILCVRDPLKPKAL